MMLYFLQVPQLIPAPILSIGFFVSLPFVLWRFYNTFREGMSYVKRLHEIPCDRCVFFTGDYRLKCTVNPCKACSEEAINCLDFEPIEGQSHWEINQYQTTKNRERKRCI